MSDLVDRLVTRARGPVPGSGLAMPARPPVPPGPAEAPDSLQRRGPAAGDPLARASEPVTTSRPADFRGSPTADDARPRPGAGAAHRRKPWGSGTRRASPHPTTPAAAAAVPPPDLRGRVTDDTSRAPAAATPPTAPPTEYAEHRRPRAPAQPDPARPGPVPADGDAATPASPANRDLPPVPEPAERPTPDPSRQQVAPEPVPARPAVSLLTPRPPFPPTPDIEGADDGATVHIHIGRVDIRGTDPAPAAPLPAPEAHPAPALPQVLSLS